MRKSSKQSVISKATETPQFQFPPDLEIALGPKPVLPFEDIKLYETLTAHVLAAIEPKDAIEFIAARNFVDITWTIARIRRYMTTMIRELMWKNIVEKIITTYEKDWVYEQKIGFFKGDQETIKDLCECLLEVSSSMEEVETHTISSLSSQIHSLEELLAQQEARRILLYREIERKRDALVKRLREQAPIIDARLVNNNVNEAVTSPSGSMSSPEDA